MANYLSLPEITDLLRCSELATSVAMNEPLRTIYVRDVLPWRQEKGFTHDRPWNEVDFSELYDWLARNTLEKFGERELRHALNVLAQDGAYNPQIELLEQLPTWDGKPHVGYTMSKILGVKQDDYSFEIERLLFRAMAQRIYFPGCKYDYMVIFKGSQGIGKSTYCEKLALNEDFYTDGVEDIRQAKATGEIIGGMVVVELGELDALRKAPDTTKRKFITQKSDRFRPAYGKQTETRPRTCVLIGTTNDEAYLGDVTGDRRFIPISCGDVKPEISVFSSDADYEIRQAWAETLINWDHKPSALILPKYLDGRLRAEKDAVTIDVPEVGLIQDYLDEKQRRQPKPYSDRVCLVEIKEAIDSPNISSTELRNIMDKYFDDWVRREGKARCMNVHTRKEYGPQHYWAKRN